MLIHVFKIHIYILSINNSQTYIPLQSFSVDQRPRELPLSSSSNKSNERKYAAVAAIDILQKYSKQFIDLPPQPPLTSHGSNNFPILKIEEDFDDIPMTNGTCKTISTQTSPVNELNAGGGQRNHKKGSANSLWTSDESILRSGETIDEEDTKSSASSSACEETGGVISSGKSGKLLVSFLLKGEKIR